MTLNQFNPTPEEVNKIKEANKSLAVLERTCFKCGHKPCSHCGGVWCDNMMYKITSKGNWEELDEEDVNENGEVYPPHACCQMSCSYL